MGIREALAKTFGRGDKAAPEALKEPIELVLQSGVPQTAARLNLLSSEFDDKRYPSGCSLSVWNEGTDERKAQMNEHLRTGTKLKHGDRSITVTGFGSTVESGVHHPEVHVSISSTQR